jgi:hypothetical protein
LAYFVSFSAFVSEEKWELCVVVVVNGGVLPNERGIREVEEDQHLLDLHRHSLALSILFL